MYAALLLVTHALAAPYILSFGRYALKATHAREVERELGSRLVAAQLRPQRCSPIPSDFLSLDLPPAAALYLARRGFRLSRDKRSARRPLFAPRNDSFLAFARTRQLRDAPARPQRRSPYAEVVAPGLEARAAWATGEIGANASVAVFDTGLPPDHGHFRARPGELVERINWTSERTLADTLGHGTFVASIVGGVGPGCPGFAPGAALHVHRVFTNQQVSYTAWFLDAFNYILWRGDVDVLNLSVGGPDFADAPFVDKVRDVVASGVTVVSAIGNDGPLWGTLNSPADMLEVVGVGGAEARSGRVAPFSSRGQTLSEAPAGGAGRAKPDVTAASNGVLGAFPNGDECRPMHGTSVASPSVAGVAALIASAARRAGAATRNPAMVRQCLHATAKPYGRFNATERASDPDGSRSSLYAQGAGRIDAAAAVACAETYAPRVSLFPAALDLAEDCPYLSPLCDQPLFSGGTGVAVNVTVANGFGVLGAVVDAKWVPGEHGEHLDVAVPSAIHGDGVTLWPWFGAVAVRVAPRATGFVGVARGALHLAVETRTDAPAKRTYPFGRPSGAGTCGGAAAESRVWVALPIAAALAAPPPRAKRVLWDATHSLAYPPIFATRDFLGQNADLLDWNGDTPETNFRETFLELRRRGFYVDVARGDLRCHDLDAYGALLIADPEDLFWDGEVDAVERAARRGLGVVVFGDWHDAALLDKSAFFDDNTQVFWRPAVGGANVPALNKLLGRFGAALGAEVYDGPLPAALGDGARFQSGNAVARFPAGGWLVHAPRLARRRSLGRAKEPEGQQRAPVLGAAETDAGRLVLFGDSGCLDEAHRQGGPCFPLLHAALAFAAAGKRDRAVFPDAARLDEDHARGAAPVDHPADAMLRKYSRHYAGAAHGPPPYDARPAELPSEPACRAAGVAALRSLAASEAAPA